MKVALFHSLAAAGMLAMIGGSALAQPVRRVNAGVGVEKKPNSPRSVAFYLTVLHHSDGESQLINAGGSNTSYGGVARFKTLVDELKAQSLTDPGDGIPRGVVMISSGDNFLAGPEFNASLTKGVPFYDSTALDLIGYDALTIGNHEFDFGPDVLQDFIESFPGTPRFITANLDFTGEPGLQALVDDGRISSSVVLSVAGQQIGVVGATTPSLPFVSSPRNVVVDSDVAGAVQAEIDALTLMGVDKIIVSTHLQAISGEYALAGEISGADVIIAGGGGELIANDDDTLVPGDTRFGTDAGGGGYPRIANDSTAKPIPVVATSGDYKYVGRLIVGFDASGNIVEVSDESGPVRVSGVGDDAVESDPTVQALVVDPVADALALLAANVVAETLVPLDGIRNNIRSFETNLGSLATDALLWNATRFAPAFGVPTPDIAIQNAGGIRNDSIIPAGDVTELDTFSILPFANFVSVVEGVTPSQLKEILENAVSLVESRNGRFAQIAGLSYSYTTTGISQVLDSAGNVVVPGTRVRNVFLNDGTPVVYEGTVINLGRTFNVATIDFLARGGDQYPFRALPFTTLGITYQQSLRDYLEEGLGGLVTAQDAAPGGEGRIIRLP